MDDRLSEFEIRLSALEILVAFQFSAQHMQTADPAGAVARLEKLLLERFTGASSDSRHAAIASELEKSIQRIVKVQETLPRRLVD